MIMVQKSVNIISSPTAIHRRLSSAPSSSFVQATRTPGLLSLSKPQQSLARRAQKQAQPKETKTSPKAARKVASAAAAAGAENSKDVASAAAKDVSPATKSSKATTPSSAEKDRTPRGRRAKVAAKDKAAPVPVPRLSSSFFAIKRNASHSRNGTRRRQPHHQGSPPQPSALANRSSPSPALDSHNQFDPFLSNSSSESDSEKDIGRVTPPPVLKTIQAPTSEPKLVSRPSGKLARRRQPLADAPGTPTPSRAVPVPRGKVQPREQAVPISRSAPQQPVPARPRPTHAHTSDVAEMFPVCDDNEDGDAVLPVTWQQAVLNDDGPRTAPLSSKFVDVPFFARVSTPTPARRRAEHVRSPSEGVFNLSFDDDSSATSSNGSEELKAIAGLLPRRRIVSASSSPARKVTTPVPSDGMYPAPFFASSNFQNSPSPDELPPPSF
ncbi:hypothetical protein PENSPDRAFT_40486 [Peniophora sp. CONT]|nr:hypothetical protein PENSPDRAFT_40486 [Peniophora sp. CONT]